MKITSRSSMLIFLQLILQSFPTWAIVIWEERISYAKIWITECKVKDFDLHLKTSYRGLHSFSRKRPYWVLNLVTLTNLEFNNKETIAIGKKIFTKSIH